MPKMMVYFENEINESAAKATEKVIDVFRNNQGILFPFKSFDKDIQKEIKDRCIDIIKDILEEKFSNDVQKIEKTIDIIIKYGGIDEAHHKAWVLDQALRILAGNNYDDIIERACNGEDGPNTYSWDTGIAP